MKNEQKNTISREMEEQRFIDYRLDQLEEKIQQGLQRLEREQNEQNKEILRMLQLMQESNNEQNKTLVELSQRQQATEQKVQSIDRLREVATKNRENIHELQRRIDVYKQLLSGVGVGVVLALIIELVTLI